RQFRGHDGKITALAHQTSSSESSLSGSGTSERRIKRSISRERTPYCSIAASCEPLVKNSFLVLWAIRSCSSRRSFQTVVVPIPRQFAISSLVHPFRYRRRYTFSLCRLVVFFKRVRIVRSPLAKPVISFQACPVAIK